MEKILMIINYIRSNKGQPYIKEINPDTKLRSDIGFSSLDLAELTVRIESEYGIDIFADGILTTVGQILDKLDMN